MEKSGEASRLTPQMTIKWHPVHYHDSRKDEDHEEQDGSSAKAARHAQDRATDLGGARAERPSSPPPDEFMLTVGDQDDEGEAEEATDASKWTVSAFSQVFASLLPSARPWQFAPDELHAMERCVFWLTDVGS